MGGVVKSVAQTVGLAPKQPQQAVQNVIDANATKPETRATRSQEEEGARLRASRRRGRQLLSDARLSSETETQTLGGGSNLG